MNTRRTQRSITLAALAAATGLALNTAQAQIDMVAWKQSNEYRAMKLQRELARDMQQDQALILGSHNSYNSSAYGQGYPYPQHSYTMSQQLDLGLRSLDLDVHVIPTAPSDLWITHATCGGWGWSAGDLTLGQALQEIRDWLDANPDEVIMLNLEQHFPMAYPSPSHTRLLNALEDAFGATSGNDRLIRPQDMGSASGSQLWQFHYYSLEELRALGRVAIFNIGGASPPCSNNYLPDNDPAQNVVFPNAPGTWWCDIRNWLFIEADAFVEDGTQWYWGSDPMGSRHHPTGDCSYKSVFAILYNNTSAGEYDDYGSTTPAVFREAIRAGFDSIRLDPVGTSDARPGFAPISFPADEQMRSTIWSWDYRYLPPANGVSLAGMAVIEGDTARIRWEYPSAEMRYALQDVHGNWSISSERGTFATPPEPGDPAFEFRVPGNGFEMQNLFGAMVRAGVTKVWINYHDLDGDGNWDPETQIRNFGLEGVPEISPVPILVADLSTLYISQVQPNHPTGSVICVYPGSYPVSIQLDKPATIVPAAHGVPTIIGQ